MRLPSLLSLGLAITAITAIVAAPAQAAFPVSDTAEILRVPPLPFVALDFDGDGRVDLLSAGAQATLYLGTADGFAPGKLVTLPGADGMTVLANAELTGDAYEDALIAFAGSGKLLLLRGRADGKPTTPPAADVYDIVAPTPGQTRPLAIGVGDVDGDGGLDATETSSAARRGPAESAPTRPRRRARPTPGRS